MARLPHDYIISPERVPIPGASITEGAGLDEVFAVSSTNEATDKRNLLSKESLAFAVPAASMFAAISIIAVRRLGKKKSEGES